MSMSIYLDYAAATPVDKRVLKAMEPYFTKEFYNPSATYLAARKVRQKLSEARATVAKYLGAKPAEIIFTAGATEANNLAVQGVMNAFPKKELLISAIEHESVLAPAGLFKSRQIKVTYQGIVDLSELKKKINDHTVLISIMLVNNEIGTLQPLREVAAVVKDIRGQRQKYGNSLPLYLHSDGAQAGNYFELKTGRLGIDMLSINGGKIYGPKQSGALFVRGGVRLLPLILGGGQEFGLRSGTENLAGAVGLAKALELAQEKRLTETKRVNQLRKLFINEVEKNIPGAILNPVGSAFADSYGTSMPARRNFNGGGSTNHQAPHIVSITFPEVDNERLMMQLDEEGIICAVSSACSGSGDEPSHVLGAIGLNDELTRATLRFSFGRNTTRGDILRATTLLRCFVSD